MRLSEKTLTDDRSIFDSIWHQLAAKKPPTLAGQIWQKWKPNSCLPRLLFPPANWSLRQTQGLAPGPLHTDVCLNPLLNNMLNKTPIKSLRIACKALSLDTPPTIPLMGLIGVFRWVHLATTDISITVDYVQATPHNPCPCFDVVLYLVVSIYLTDT